MAGVVTSPIGTFPRWSEGPIERLKGLRDDHKRDDGGLPACEKGKTFRDEQMDPSASVPPVAIASISAVYHKDEVDCLMNVSLVMPRQWAHFIQVHWRALWRIWLHWPYRPGTELRRWNEWSEAKKEAAAWIWPETTSGEPINPARWMPIAFWR